MSAVSKDSLESCRFSKDVLSIRISRTTLCDIIKRVGGALEDPNDELLGHIREEEALNVDESRWKDSGARYWIWVFFTKLLALFLIQKSRGCIVLDAILGDAFAGTITSEFYGSDISYLEKSTILFSAPDQRHKILNNSSSS
jgi:hypothetical protein